MTQIKRGYPFSYGDELTPEMARKNRKSVYVYSVFTYSIWIKILGFGKQTQSPYPNQYIPKTEIVMLVQSHHLVNSISRGGDLGKSGPGPRAKADAARNVGKQKGGSIFVQGFTPQRQYGSHPTNKPLSCRNNVKLKNNPFDNNQDPRVENNAANTNSQVKKDEVAKLSESVTKSYSEIKHELEIKQHQKTVKIDVAGKTYMIENADRMGVDQLENKLAEQMYNSIRDNHKDISDIAGNLEFKADNIKNVKDHVFYKEHVLDRYAHLGDDPVVQRFDPDLKQALAWKRFEIGEHTPEDIE